ncbi:MAG: hypothetical protein IT317_09730 [Anaerolineales bacterium]|nr:hypothetical protein [Anaerolineales bacterium]
MRPAASLARFAAVRRWWPYAALTLLCLLAAVPLANANLPCSDDGPFHLYRAVELGRLLHLGHWLPRWAPDMAQGYGYPFFNFYAPLSSYGVVALHGLGFTYPAALKAAFILGVWAAGLAVFWLGRALWGERAGVAAGAAYLLAPYLAYDLLFRGNLAEAWGFIWPPLALLGLHRRGRWGWLLAALAYAALILTHNVFALLASPLLGAHLVLRAAQRRSWAVLARGGLALAAGLALTAYFWLPALAERGQVHADRLLVPPIFTWYTNFITPSDVLAAPQVEDPLLVNPSPIRAVGLVTVLLGLPAVAAALWALARRQANSTHAAVGFLALALAGYAFMTVEASTLIWRALKPLELVQFPWRMLGPAALCAALLVGAGVPVLERLARRAGRWAGALVVGGVLALLVLANNGWWYPRYCPTPRTVGVADLLQYERDTHTVGTTAKGEYLPRAVGAPPQGTALAEALARGEEPDRLLRLAGLTVTRAQAADPLDATYTVDAARATVALYQQLYYPGWQAAVDGQPVAAQAAPESTGQGGLVAFELPAGTHTLRVWFGPTPLRALAGAVSLAALAGLGLAVVVVARRRATVSAAPEATGAPTPASTAGLLLLVCALLPALKWGVIDRTPNPLRRAALDPATLPLTGPLGQSPLEADFAGGIRLHGYDLSATQLRADEALEVALYVSRWAASQRRYWPAFSLVDATGFAWQAPEALPPRWQREPPPTNLWPLDEYAQWARHLTLLPGTPPGTYTLRGEVFDLDSLVIASRLDAAGNAVAPRFDLGALTVERPRAPATLTPALVLNAPLGPLTLLGADLPPAAANAGDTLPLTLYWRSDAATNADLNLNLTLRAPDDSAAATISVPPVAGFGTSHWQPGDAWRGRHQLRLPADLPSGEYVVWAALLGEPGEARVGAFTLTAPPRSYTAPPMQAAAGGVFEGVGALAGYTLTPEAGTLTVQLVWQATATPPIGYKVFVHLQGADGRVWAQSDGVPAGWARPTTGWLAGEYVVDEHTLALPGDLPAGDYTLYVGLYDADTNTRVPPTGPGAGPDGRLALTRVTIPP